MSRELQTVTPALAIVEGVATTTSLEVARHFNRPHDEVLRRIRNLLSQLDGEYLRNFAEVTHEYSNGKGGTQTAPAYRLTRDGFTLLAMGFTGKKALQFKLAYIDAFNRMEATLKSGPLTIDPGQQQTLKVMVNATALVKNMTHQEIWTRLHCRFGVAQYNQIPSSRFAEAVGYLQDDVAFDDDAMASMVRRAFLANRRFLLTFNHRGEPQVSTIHQDEAVVGPDGIPSLIAGGFIPRECLPDIVRSVASKL